MVGGMLRTNIDSVGLNRSCGALAVARQQIRFGAATVSSGVFAPASPRARLS